MPYTDTTVSNFIINVLTKNEYDSIATPSESELYLITDDSTITAGTGISVSTVNGISTVNHSNSVTAQTTQAVYPIKIDAQGHITAYGSAVTIPEGLPSVSLTDNGKVLMVVNGVWAAATLTQANGNSF